MNKEDAMFKKRFMEERQCYMGFCGHSNDRLCPSEL
jgi:hypothetical protein